MRRNPVQQVAAAEPLATAGLLLLLLLLQAGYEHLFGPLGRLQVVPQNPVEELHKILVALLLGVLDVALERFGVIRGLIEYGYQVVVLILRLSRCFGHLLSFR